MHVAMTAVVSARARLRSRCCDILLLPKFVTVDTTSTLGWESVFLRFTIVRWPAMPQGCVSFGGMSWIGFANVHAQIHTVTHKHMCVRACRQLLCVACNALIKHNSPTPTHTGDWPARLQG